jgi:hypothetical protein
MKNREENEIKDQRIERRNREKNNEMKQEKEKGNELQRSLKQQEW